MRSLSRHLAVLALVAGTVGATALPAAAADETVVGVKFEWLPGSVSPGLGDEVSWFMEQGTHEVSDRQPEFAVLNGPLQAPGDTAWEHTFIAAGTYLYVCRRHETMLGNVKVRPRAQFTDSGDVFVRWALVPAPTGYVYDVQYRPNGETPWVMWRNAVTNGASVFDSDYGHSEFRARMRKPGVGGSAWSPVRTIFGG